MNGEEIQAVKVNAADPHSIAYMTPLAPEFKNTFTWASVVPVSLKALPNGVSTNRGWLYTKAKCSLPNGRLFIL